MAADSNRIPSLDGWRAIAVTLVVVYHAAAAYAASWNEFEGSFAWTFSVGVDVFFAISGLLITLRLLEEWKQTGAVNLRGFYIRRAFRILPPATCVLVVTTLLHAHGSRMDFISCFTFWRNYLPPAAGAWSTSHFWSLSLEEQFYLIWPGILVLAGYSRAPRLLFWAILSVCMWRSVALRIWQTPGIMFHTDLRVDGLLWGCLMAFAFHQFRVPRWLFALSVMAAVVITGWYRYGGGLIVLPAALAVAVVGTSQHHNWTVSRMLDWKPLSWIGRISYSIYLWQQIFLVPDWNPRFSLHWPILARIAAILVASSASYYLLETPCIRLGKRLAARERRANQKMETLLSLGASAAR